MGKLIWVGLIVLVIAASACAEANDRVIPGLDGPSIDQSTVQDQMPVDYPVSDNMGPVLDGQPPVLDGQPPVLDGQPPVDTQWPVDTKPPVDTTSPVDTTPPPSDHAVPVDLHVAPDKAIPLDSAPPIGCGAMKVVGSYATWCGKVNVHEDSSGGWVVDSDCKSGCGINTVSYCKKLYPTATKQVQITPILPLKPFTDAGCKNKYMSKGQKQFLCCAP